MTTQKRDGSDVQVPSLFEALATSLTSRTREARRERLEVGLGVLLFFSFAAVVSTAVAELQGRAALHEAVVAMCFLLPTYLVYRSWRKAG